MKTDCRRAVGSLLGSYGFDLAETTNADAALKHCRRTRPMSWSPPTGLAACRRRNSSSGCADGQGGRRQPVVLVCTERADTEEIGRAIIEGAAEYLLKPFDRELLEFKLRQVGLL